MKGVLNPWYAQSTTQSMSAPLPAEFAVPVQRFTIYPFERNVLRCKKGTIVTIEADSLTFMNGIPIGGKVDVEIKEIVSCRDLLFENLTTYTEDQLLDNIYTVYINATSDDEYVDSQTNYPIKIELPGKVTSAWEDIEIYRGGKLDQQRRPWLIDARYSKIVYQTEKVEKPHSGFGFFSQTKKQVALPAAQQVLGHLEISQLGWINCAKPFPTDKLKNLEASLSITETTEAEVYIMVVLENYGSCIPVFRSEHKFVAPYLPIGEEVNIVGIGKMNDTYYFAGKTAKVGSGEQQEELDFKSSSIAAIRKRLRALG